MKKVLLFCSVILLILISGCSDEKNSKNTTVANEQKQQEVKKKVPQTLKEKLDSLLEYNGKECSRPASPLVIKSITWDTDSSSHKTDVKRHSNVYSNGGGSYTTHEYTTGGGTRTEYHGATLYIEIENKSDKKVYASLDVDIPTSEYGSFFGFFGGYHAKSKNVYESFDVLPEGKKYSQYIEFNGYISDTPNAKISATYFEEDDKRFRNATTIKEYHKYLQYDGCHYHIQKAQQKIKELVNQKTYDEAIAHPEPKDRIVALEKYLEVFKNTSNGKLANKQLQLDKRMVALLNMTKDYKTVLWEINNPLLYSYVPTLKKDETNDNLTFFTYDYIEASKQNYMKQIYTPSKPLPAEPKKDDFGTKPIKESYPAEPNMQKGEFEKQSDFTLRKNEAYATWEKQKSEIDAKHEKALMLYTSEQNQLYTAAYAKWQEAMKVTQEENEKAKALYEQRVNAIDENRDKWEWEAVLAALGREPLGFKKLEYDSERELFEYEVVGGDLNFRFQGTISLPIDKAKAFKDAMLGDERGISFALKDDMLYVDKFLYKGDYYPYTVTNGTQLVLIDMREIKKREQEREQERKAEEDRIAREEDRIAREEAWLKRYEKVVFYDTKRKLIWQDDPSVKTTQKNWHDAIKHCQKLEFAGKSDWRLPTLDELKVLYEKKNYLRNVASYHYWSSSGRVSDSSIAWRVNFSNGNTSNYGKSHMYYGRCVRGRQ